MKFKDSLRMLLILPGLLTATLSPALAQDKLIGSKVINFSLASTQDRLITYGDEYYGRHHLIMTFFPAAFTPV
jgi:hypothetical protein